MLASVVSVSCGSSDDGGSASCPSGKCSPVDGGAKGQLDGGRGDAGDREGGAPANCMPEAGADLPDDNFADTNCDGIDGDANRAVFLALSGSDGSAGTRSAPVRTFAKALGLAVAGSKDIYVCNGLYDEQVQMLGEGASVYGGYDCSQGWKRVADRAVVAPTSGVPLTIRALATPVVLERLAFRAPSTQTPGASSIAAVALDSMSVRLLRVELTAAAAGKGVDGAVVADPAWTPAQTGANAPDTFGAGQSNCPMGANCASIPIGACAIVPARGQGLSTYCSDGAEILGGPGGSGANAKVGGAGPVLGSAGKPASTTPNGADGSEPPAGQAAMNGFGTIANGSYVADNNGADGSRGGHGQSGTGGSGGASSCYCVPDTCGTSYLNIAGGGGQGGYGGCGGPGGKGGGGGGASIGLLTSNSTVELKLCTVNTGAGGAGGASNAGRAGQPGSPGGNGGAGSGIVPGAPGGRGGNGGKGSDGGPGGGGPSVGVVYSGARPTSDQTTFQLGAPGKGAPGIAGGRGVDGLQAEFHDVG